MNVFSKMKSIFKKTISIILVFSLTVCFLTCGDLYNQSMVWAGENEIIYGDVDSHGVISILDMIMFKSYCNDQAFL